MRFSSSSTFSAFSVVLFAWTLVVQGAAISSVDRDRAAIVNFGPSVDIIVSSWRRRIAAREDSDCWYTAPDFSDSKREDTDTHTPCGELLERVDAPGDDTSFTPDEPSTPTECNAPDGGDCKYSLVYTESETEEGGELATTREISPDLDAWYTALGDAEGSV